jgi:hypothetical protein
MVTMTSQVFEKLTADIAARGAITPDDVLALRRAAYPDGIIARSEVEALLALERSTGSTSCPEWKALVIEALVDHVVHQTEPVGAVADGETEWLIGILNGRVATPVELEALVAILEAARAMPPALSAFALQQVKDGCLTGEGPTARGRCHYSRVVDAADVELLRRMLFASGGDGSIDVTRAEAEVLFDLHDQTVGQDNDPGFSDLFVKAIAQHVLAASGRQVPTRDALFRRMDGREGTGVFGVFDRLRAAGFTSPFSGVAALLRSPQEAVEATYADLNRHRAAAAAIGADEAAWLARRIMRDGRPTDAEKALLTFILDANGNLDPSLAELLARAA